MRRAKYTPRHLRRRCASPPYLLRVDTGYHFTTIVPATRSPMRCRQSLLSIEIRAGMEKKSVSTGNRTFLMIAWASEACSPERLTTGARGSFCRWSSPPPTP